MSADRHSSCPKCLAEKWGVPIGQLTVQDIYMDEGKFAAYQEVYIDEGFLVIRYAADCPDCDYRVVYNHREPVPES